MNRRLKRILTSILMIFAVIGVVLTTLFCIFIYNPLEGSCDAIGTLVPRSVSFFVTKRDLGDELLALPNQREFKEIGESKAVKSFLNSQFFLSADQRFAIQENLDRLEQINNELPVDIFGDVFGSELGIAGTPLGAEVTKWDVIFYTRVGWKIRPMIDLCTHPQILKRARLDPALSLGDEDGGAFKRVSYVQSGKAMSFFFGRVKDVLVVSNKKELMREVLALGFEGSGTSLYYDREYEDPVEALAESKESPEGVASPVGLHVNLAEVKRLYGVDQKLEEGQVGTGTKIAADMLGLQTMSRFVGVFHPQTPLTLEGRIDLDVSKAGNNRRILTTDGLPVSEIRDRLGAILPKDTFFFMFVRCGVRDLFQLIMTNFSGADRQLINDSLKKIPELDNLNDFLAKTSSHFTDEVAAIFSRRDISQLTGAQRFNPKPAMTLMLQTLDSTALLDYLKILERDEFAIAGVTKSDLAGVSVTRGRSKIDGADMAYAIFDDRFIISTSPDFLDQIILVAKGQLSGLMEDEGFDTAMNSVGDKATLLFYLNGGKGLDWLVDYSDKIANDANFMSPDDWIKFRGEVRRELQQSSGLRGPELERALDRRAQEKQGDIERIDIPKMKQTIAEISDWSRLVDSITGVISFQGESAVSKMILQLNTEKPE